jgi:hypothetical protein
MNGGPQGGQDRDRSGAHRGGRGRRGARSGGAGAPLPLGRDRRGLVLASRGWSRGARVLIGVERGVLGRV